jgi:isoquinoline 1-oxidoreductase subunit beta
MSAAMMNRRGLLRAAAAGISVSFMAGCSILPPIPKRPMPTKEDATGWVRLMPEGGFEVLCPRMEMGQNILSAVRELAALELGVKAQDVQVRLPSTAQIARAKATVGSDSVRELALPLSQACFALREAIMARAAQRLGSSAPSNSLRIEAGQVISATGARVALQEIAQPALEIKAQDVPKEQLKFWKRSGSAPVAERALFAQESELLRGQALFAADIRLAGMLYAMVLRSPWPDQALTPTRLLSWNEVAVRQVPGFHSIVQHPLLAGPAMVATRMSALLRMRELADAKWSLPEAAQMDPMRSIDVDAVLQAGSFTKSQGQFKQHSVQDLASALNLRVDVPLASHGFIEPRCAVAHFDAEKTLKVWCGTQDAFYIRDVMKRDHDLSLEAITVQPMRIGGAFGGKTVATVEREAAIIAKAVKAPVKVQWSRADEFQAAFHRQPSSHRISVQMAQGQITDWRHSLSTSHVLFTNAVAPPWMQKLTNLIIGDDGAARGQLPVYGFTRQQLDLQLTRLPVLTGPWRGLGAGPNVLAIEVAMDRAAMAAQADPLQFRLKHLKQAKPSKAGDPNRVAQCLGKLAILMQKQPMVGKESRQSAMKLGVNRDAEVRWFEAQGVGCGAYKGMSYAAAGAQVRVQVNAQGQLQAVELQKIWCTHDCGRMVDADGVLAQVQGNLVWCIGMVLRERITAPQGWVQETNLAQQNILRMEDVPPMHIELLTSNEEPSGAGETAMVAGAGAIANAVLRAMDLAGVKPPDHLRFPLIS